MKVPYFRVGGEQMKKPSNITTVCKGNRPYAGGYKWQYAPSKKEVMPNDVK